MYSQYRTRIKKINKKILKRENWNSDLMKYKN